MDSYADDLAAVIDALDLNDATLVGHSTGGEVTRYIGHHGTNRVDKAVLIAAMPPVMLKSSANPEGLPMEAFNDMRSGLHLPYSLLCLTASMMDFINSTPCSCFCILWKWSSHNTATTASSCSSLPTIKRAIKVAALYGLL